MAGEGIHAVRETLEMEAVQVQLEVGEFLDKLVDSFPEDRIDGPKKTRLFAFAVLNERTRRENQYVAVTTNDQCSGNHPVEYGKFRIHVQTKAGQPGSDWRHCLFWNKGGGKEWWEYDPPNQEISKEIMEWVSKTRKSIQEAS